MNKTGFTKAVVLTQGGPVLPGHMWRCLGTFLVISTRQVGASGTWGGWSPGTPPDTPRGARRSVPRAQVGEESLPQAAEKPKPGAIKPTAASL